MNQNVNHQEAADELRGIVEHEGFPSGVPVLVLANKQDLPNAARPAEIIDKLQLESFRYATAFLLNYTGYLA